jgi:pimeloyl-ACP methyl ester carboxylesterase
MTFSKITLHHGPLTFTGLTRGQGPLVLLLHGFPDNARTWRHQLPALAEAGYRAVAMTLRGYEPGSQPANGDYTRETIASDVTSFLDELEVDTAHLVGHDWGAVITYTACAQAPERFKSLTTLALPHVGRFLTEVIKHPRQLRLSWYMFFFQIRGLADYLVERNDYAFIKMLWRRWSPGWQLTDDEMSQVIETFRQPGVKRSALAYYRTILSPRRFPISRAAREAARFPVPVPTLAVTGANDGCIDTDVHQQLMVPGDFPRGLEVRQITGAGHFPQLEQPQQVNALLLDWLAQHDTPERSTS